MPFGMSTASGDTALSLAAQAATVSSGSIAAAGGAGYVLGMAQVKTITGTTPTVVFSLDESDNGSTGWTAMLGATTASITAAGSAVFFGRPAKQYVRVTATIGGTTPAITGEVAVIAFAD
jgi:hypothetical protein